MDPVDGGSSCLIFAYQCSSNSVFLRPHVLVLSPVSLIDLLASVCGLSSLPPLSPGSYAIQGFITLVMMMKRLDVQHLVLMPVYVPSLNPSQPVGLEKEALGLKLLHSVTKGYWPIQM